MNVYLLFLIAAELLGEKLVFSRDFNYFILIRSFFNGLLLLELANVSALKKVRYKCHHLSITPKNREKLYRYSSKGKDPIIITFDFEIDCYTVPSKKDFFNYFFSRFMFHWFVFVKYTWAGGGGRKSFQHIL